MKGGGTKALCDAVPSIFWAGALAPLCMGLGQRHRLRVPVIGASTCNARDKREMNDHVVWLLVAMVSVGLVGSMVTRQRERVQDKGSWCEGEVWGRCECMRGEVGRRHREDTQRGQGREPGRHSGQDRERQKERQRQRQTEREGGAEKGKAERDTAHRKRLREAEIVKPRKTTETRRDRYREMGRNREIFIHP